MSNLTNIESYRKPTPTKLDPQDVEMPDLPDTQAPQPTRKSLWPIYHLASAYEYTDPARARQVLDTVQAEGLDNYTAPPELWHNVSMVAARVLHQEIELALIQAGLREWPDHIDLLCDGMVRLRPEIG